MNFMQMPRSCCPMNPNQPERRLPRRALPAALALAFALSGCASLLQQTTSLPRTPVPAAWSTGAATPAAATSLAQWWQRFNDPLLGTLVTQALQANSTVRTAQAALQQARALRDVRSANLFPTVAASAAAQRSQSGGNDASNNFRAGFDASWEPDVFGARRSALSATEADAQAAQASLADTQVSIAAEVAVTYIELRGLQARLTIARNNLASQTETQQITSWRVQAGLASSLDLEQARAASAQTSAQIPLLQTSAAQAQHSLAVLTGQAPGALQATLDAARPMPQAPVDLALGIPAETLRQRPDVRAAEHRISAALARVSQADAARYPGFQLSGSLGLSALTLGSLTTAGTVANSLLGSVSIPLFDGGAARAQVRAQEAVLEQTRVGYQATVLTALKDVEDALVALQGDRERLARLELAADAAGNAELLARQRYASGLIDFRSVLETQRTLLSTQDSVESTRASLSADHVRLYKALGGGWVPATEPARL
jgi:multidrug efflux system outer membrane protein